MKRAKPRSKQSPSLKRAKPTQRAGIKRKRAAKSKTKSRTDLPRASGTGHGKKRQRATSLALRNDDDNARSQAQHPDGTPAPEVQRTVLLPQPDLLTRARQPSIDAKDFCARALSYCLRVLSLHPSLPAIPACKWIRLACQRHLDDLDRQPDPVYPWAFYEELGNRVCRFIEHLPHIKGQWKSRIKEGQAKNVELEDWQCFLLTSLFGWVDRVTRIRRFRKALVLTPRKNGKTFLAAAVGLYLLCADEEPGSEVVSAAVTRDQAKLVWETAWNMVKREPDLREAYDVQPFAHIISVLSTASVFKPLSRDADSLEGLNPHGAIIDELHAHKTREVFDVLNQATGSRRQPLLFIISTAGDNRTGVCYEQVDYGQQVLQHRHEDDRYFFLLYTCDPELDWTTDAAARMANPNYGVSVLADDIQSACLQAQRSADSQNTYKTKRLNIWVSTGTAYFNMLAWQSKCYVPSLKLEDFYEQDCLIALDLASKVDIAAKIYLFNRDGRRYLFGKYYLPEDVVERGNPNYDLYSGWRERGLLTLTPGNIIDFEFIEQDLLQDRDHFCVREVCYDPYQATELSTRMAKEGLPMVEVGATVRNFSEPMKLMDALILSGKILHSGDPVLEWMVGNVHAQKDAKDNVYPRKIRNENKIDGAVGAIMCLGRDIAYSGTGTSSVYEERGIMFLGD